MGAPSARPDRSAGVDLPPEFAAWRALGMLIQLGVTDPAKLAPARQLLKEDLDALDLACSRFRPDSELVAVGSAARGAPGPVTLPVSQLLAEAVEVSLRAAELTDGDVDPTLGGVMAALGYDRDFAELPTATTSEIVDHDVHPDVHNGPRSPWEPGTGTAARRGRPAPSPSGRSRAGVRSRSTSRPES